MIRLLLRHPLLGEVVLYILLLELARVIGG
jgi:hypothetical protein